MILTVTLNPAIDKVLILKKFELHKLHRLQSKEMSLCVPGGKGVNIALTLKMMGDDVVATGFAAGHSGHMLCDSMRRKGITTSFIFTEGATRMNTSILDLENETLTEINDFGQEVFTDEVDYFIENYERLVNQVEMVVIAGSLPRVINQDVYAQLIDIAHSKGKKVLFHATPDLFEPLMGNSPFIVNPDMRSNHTFLGQPLDGITSFIDLGKKILKQNPKTEFVVFTHRIENVVVTTRNGSFILCPQKLKIVNMLGYADAYLAGFVHAYLAGLPTIDVLKYASATGLTNVESLTKEIDNIDIVSENISRIEVEELP